MNEAQENQMSKNPDLFKIAYWTAAGVQMVGTLAFFWEIGGYSFRGGLYALSGAVCLELMILALNTYGETRVGFFRTALMLTSIFLVFVSGGIQIADIFAADADTIMAGKLLWAYAPMKVIVAAIPSFAMAIITIVKFSGDAGDVTKELKRLADQLKDWDTWQTDQDQKMAEKDGMISELTAKLDEARNRPMLQQLVTGVDTLRTRSEISLPELPEPATMPDTLLIDDENALIRQYLSEGLSQIETVKKLMAGYGLTKRSAENQPEYDRQYKRLSPKVARWQNKQHSTSTAQSTSSVRAVR